MNEIIEKIKQKKEFSQLPGSVFERVLNLKKIKDLSDRGKIKESRRILRKTFTAFLTNKILKGKVSAEELLKTHYSTRSRDYESLYKKILDNEKTIIDLGAGINGFSYNFINEHKRYIAIEAVGQIVNLMNDYFEKNDFNAFAVHEDLFNIDKIIKILKKADKPKVAFMFNLIDSFEFLERDFSKAFIFKIIGLVGKIVLSFPVESLAFTKNKRKTFKARRFWLIDFIGNNFEVLEDFEMQGERFIVFKKR